MAISLKPGVPRHAPRSAEPDCRPHHERSLLEESARLFALSGGWRRPGAKLDPALRGAFWICRAPDDARPRAARGRADQQRRNGHGLPELPEEN